MGENYKTVSWPGWEPVRIIGRGSFGSVYEIQREVFGEVEKAALKVISIPQNESDVDEMYSDGHDEESITKIINGHMESVVAEYTLMRKMNGSANIVNCEDIRYVQHNDGIGWDIFIKMELLTPLVKSLPQEIPEETVEKLAKDMCNALILCKQHNIVHRDIKPQNIFLSPYGDYKLGDFGIAKTVEKTLGGTKIGTDKYMAPEVYNHKPYGSAADIYSLGLVLYWLLNERRLPFLPMPPEKIGSGMEEEARNRRMEGESFLPPKHGSQKLKAIVMKACAYNPKERYQSAEEMLDALTSKRVAPPPPPPPPRKHQVTVLLRDSGSKQRIALPECVQLFVGSSSIGLIRDAFSRDRLAISLLTEKLGEYEFSCFDVAGDSGKKYSELLKYQPTSRKYEMLMVDENITIWVNLKKKKSPRDNKKMIMIASAVIALCVLGTAFMEGKPEPVTKTTPKPSYTSTVKTTPKPVATPKPTIKPVSTPKPTAKPVATTKPELYSESEIQSMLKKLKDPPNSSELLNNYKQGYIASSKGNSVYGYSVHKVVVNGETVAKPIFSINDGAEITIVGYNSGNDRYCVIVNSTDKACWVNADYVR